MGIKEFLAFEKKKIVLPIILLLLLAIALIPDFATIHSHAFVLQRTKPAA